MTTTTTTKPASKPTTPAKKAPAAKKAPKPAKNPLADLRAQAAALLALIDKAIAEKDDEDRECIVTEVENLADAIAGDAADIAADMLPSSPDRLARSGLRPLGEIP